MIDFTNAKVNKFKMYGGSNGGKMGIIYDDEYYMLKFPSKKENLGISYTNSCFSEYISCKIISSIGLNVQETLLGTYTIDSKERIVVACKDFVNDGYVLKEFAYLKNSLIESSYSGYGTELSEVLETIEEEDIYDNIELKKYFWDLFIVDALLGNFDRHNGNWGFLVNEERESVKLAPIYDCGSCLYPQLSDEEIERVMNSDDEINSRIFVFPNSALKINGKKINYFNYISSLENQDCNEALKRIVPKIDISSIYEIIDNTDYISTIRKEFYKKMISLRYEKILKYCYDLLLEGNNE